MPNGCILVIPAHRNTTWTHAYPASSTHPVHLHMRIPCVHPFCMYGIQISKEAAPNPSELRTFNILSYHMRNPKCWTLYPLIHIWHPPYFKFTYSKLCNCKRLACNPEGGNPPKHINPALQFSFSQQCNTYVSKLHDWRSWTHLSLIMLLLPEVQIVQLVLVV
jgi:hypothetical protein